MRRGGGRFATSKAAWGYEVGLWSGCVVARREHGGTGGARGTTGHQARTRTGAAAGWGEWGGLPGAN